MDLFTNKIPLEQKKITAEVCIHHLWFTNDDYATKNLIKWNPAVKQQMTKSAMGSFIGRKNRCGCNRSRTILWKKRNNPILKAPSGGPLVQHAVVAMFESFHQGKISIEKIVEKCAIIRPRFLR
jgi:dihydroorotase